MTKKKDSVLIYGKHAVNALIEKRLDDVIRVYCLKELMKDYSNLLKWCAAEKKAYHLVTKEEMEKITLSKHHEGVCVLAKHPRALSEEEFLKNLSEGKITGPLVFLDGVMNSHNLGAICRTMAHFSAGYIIGVERDLPAPSPSWIRLSEGGYEHINRICVKDPEIFLKNIKSQNYQILGLSSHAKDSLYKEALPKKCMFVLGNEIKGLSINVKQHLTKTIIIPGSGLVESLNVSVATALCLGEWARVHLYNV